jgi:hypothetical protein
LPPDWVRLLDNSAILHPLIDKQANTMGERNLAKRLRRSRTLLTSAAHARFEQIDLGDVAPVIESTKELIGAHLA